jgi:hypothetical protein
VVSRSFPAGGVYRIGLCVNGSAATQRQDVTVRNRPPRALFTVSPGWPTVGEPVTLTSTAVDQEGPIASYAWDLDGDGGFDDGAAVSASVTFTTPGFHTAGLQVVDRDGAGAVLQRPIFVLERPPELLSPFPLVRLVVRATRHGARVVLLTVRGPRGIRIKVRCRGRDCPWRRRSVRPADGSTRFRRLQRWLRAGTVIEVLATRRGSVGKYSRFWIRARGRPPARVDACLVPADNRPRRCPAATDGP